MLSPVIGSAARPMFATELSGALAAASGTSAPSTRRNLGITTIALLEGAAALRCGRGALATGRPRCLLSQGCIRTERILAT